VTLVTDKLLDDLKLALGDSYTVERELTGGGMSRVFVAREQALGREVVIKVLPPDLAAGVNRERFRQEVQLAARLSHPYIVPLLHAGERGELLWFTMPYIQGESLRAHLQRTGPLKVDEVLRLLRDVVEALAYAHSQGVIHRDIKPANILFDGHHALVTDFGVAKALSAALPGPRGHTTSGMAIGTPAYMAPEQLAADPSADQRVDIYAVGLLAYELLSGASPFAAPSPTATMTAQLTRVPEPLHEMRPEVPAAFSNLVQQCLAKSPEDRPADARAVLAELDKISGALAADQHRGLDGGRPMARASAWPLAVATLGVVGLVVAGVIFAQRGATPPPPVAPETLVVQGGRDSADGVPLGSKTLTRADSLRIAAAMRDELQQIDPQYSASRSAAVAESTAALGSLEHQLAEVDSLIRARLADRPRAVTSGLSDRGVLVMPNPQGTPPTPGAGAPPTPLRKLLVITPRRRESAISGRDSAAHALADSAARELERRLARVGGWQLVTPDTSSSRRGGGPSFGGAEVLAIVAVDTASTTDSLYLRINLRNLAPGSAYGTQVVQSDPVYRPTTIDRFRGTIRDAARFLDDLRRLPAGETWTYDFGRSGRGGPSQQFLERMDTTMFRVADSLRKLRPGGRRSGQ
jgi:hypothetical protein